MSGAVFFIFFCSFDISIYANKKFLLENWYALLSLNLVILWIPFCSLLLMCPSAFSFCVFSINRTLRNNETEIFCWLVQKDALTTQAYTCSLQNVYRRVKKWWRRSCFENPSQFYYIIVNMLRILFFKRHGQIFT